MRGFMLLIIFSGINSSLSDDEQCSKDDLSCSEGGKRSGLVDEADYEAYKHKKLTSREDFKIREMLDKIDTMKAGDPRGALKLVEVVLKEHPESPRALHSLARIYRTLYNNLSEENKSIGRIEYLQKLMETVMKVVRMDSENLPLALLTTIADYGIANFVAMEEREWTILLATELVFGPRRGEFTPEDQEFHFQTLLDEKFFRGDLTECKELIIARTTNTTDASMSMRFLMAIIVRLQEKDSDNPFEQGISGEMIEALLPDGDDEKDELFIYTEDLEKQLRRMEKIDAVNVIHDLLVDMKIYPSRYQRPLTKVNGLKAKPIWTKEETGYEDKLTELENNWETIRDEALVLIKNTPEQNITMGEKEVESTRKWKQYLLHGFGTAPFPDYMCQHTPVTCALLKDYPIATKCPLGSIKISVIEPGAHLLPHTGGTNFRLRVHLPLVVPAPNSTEFKNLARMRIAAEPAVVWEEGKIVVFDDSFEHEVWNLTNEPRIIFIADFIHPEMTQEQFNEIEQLYTYSNELGHESGPVAMPNFDNLKPK